MEGAKKEKKQPVKPTEEEIKAMKEKKALEKQTKEQNPDGKVLDEVTGEMVSKKYTSSFYH